MSVDEAKDVLAKWYKDRPEVQEWQRQTILTAKQTGYTRTLMGRYRPLPDINSKNKWKWKEEWNRYEGIRSSH